MAPRQPAVHKSLSINNLRIQNKLENNVKKKLAVRSC
jgi:hypothetical protein